MKIAVAVDANMGMNSPVAFRFARAPFFAIVEVNNGNIVNINIVQNPNAFVRGGAGPATAQWLASMGVNAVIGPRVGPNASGALAALGIQVYVAPPGIPLVEALRMNGLIR